MSKEIYKEYVNKYFFECKSEDDRIELNKQYLHCYGDFSSSFDIYHSQYPASFVNLYHSGYESVKRKPKTQMINGREVVAPKYGFPDDGLDHVFTFDSVNGCTKLYRTGIEWRTNFRFGYFENEKDAISYTDAHRENKND